MADHQRTTHRRDTQSAGGLRSWWPSFLASFSVSRGKMAATGMPDSQSDRRWLSYGLKVGLTLVVLIVLFSKVDTQEMVRAFGTVHWPFLVGALVLVGPNLGLQWYRWRYLVRLVKPHVATGEIVRSSLAGLSLGLVTPGRIGEAGKIFYVQDVRRRALAGMLVGERAYTAVTNIGLGGIAFAVFIGAYWWIVFSLLALALLSLAWTPEAGVRLLKRLLSKLPLGGKLTPVLDGLSHLNGEKGRKLLFLSVLLFGIHWTQFYLLISAFGHIGMREALWAIPAIVFVRSIFPFTLGDLGIREAAAVFVLGRFGIASAVAVDAALLLFGMNVLLPGLLGTFLVHRVRREEISP
ncbi:MAG: lysylphosphatidylglycerol synthase transmembrane domain-containing protein [Candidatus Latescibacterota bacterium]